MIEKKYDVVVIGAGPAGLAAAISASDNGATVALIERDHLLGGILPQCIHNGFGLHLFKKDLTGPEYAEHFINQLKEKKVEVFSETMALDISKNDNDSDNDARDKSFKHRIIGVNRQDGLICFNTKSTILAMGCRERTRGNLAIAGTRPAGIYTAGTAQRLTNIEGYRPGNEIVVLGSGDIGLIMARRLTYEGAKVKAVLDILPYLSGLTRNKVQCLDDYEIPLYLQHTVTFIKGNKRVEGVEIAEVDENRKVKDETRRFISCDTLLLSVGLIPENELSEKLGVNIDKVTNGPVVDSTFQTSVDGVFACGNVMHVSDLVDYVSLDGSRAGKAAALYSQNKFDNNACCEVLAGNNVTYVVPQKINIEASDFTDVPISFRVKQPIKNVKIKISNGSEILYQSGLKKIIRPGEMERVELNEKIVSELNKSQKLTVSVESL